MAKIMNLDDIKIRENYLESTPRQEKMKECRDFWAVNEHQDRYLVVNRDGFLIDGYVQYLVLKENGCKTAMVKISNHKKKRWNRIDAEKFDLVTDKNDYRTSPTTYVYGYHFGKQWHKPKEYVWRVPRNKNMTINIGDIVFVNTKDGISRIKVSKVEKLDKSPVNFPVKRVVNTKN